MPQPTIVIPAAPRRPRLAPLVVLGVFTLGMALSLSATVAMAQHGQERGRGGGEHWRSHGDGGRVGGALLGLGVGALLGGAIYGTHQYYATPPAVYYPPTRGGYYAAPPPAYYYGY